MEVDFNNEPIFILGCHKSGTSLLRSLFDGHKDLQVIPIESHVMELLNFKSLNKIRATDNCNKNKTKNYLEKLIALIESYKNSNSRLTDNYSFKKFKIKNIINENPNNEIKESIKHIWYLLLEQSKDGFSTRKRIVEKSVENFEFAAYLKLIFPQAHFIHILRNPYDNLVALRVFKGNNNYPSLIELVDTIKKSFLFAENNSRVIDNYHVINYKDLCDNTHSLLSGLVKKLNLSIDKELFMPTYDGSPWQGNSSRKLSFTGVSSYKSRINELKPLEVEMINRNFGEILGKKDFSLVEISKYSYLKKCPKESLKTYIRNRAALIFSV